MRIRSFISMLLGLLLVAASGAAHGWRTGRWDSIDALHDAVARLDTVPEIIGDWQSEPLTLDERQLAISEAVGHLSRRYVHRRTKTVVTVAVLCGRPGPLSAHTPDICYSGAGFEMKGRPDKRLILNVGIPAEVWSARFVQATADGESLRIDWAWSHGKAWFAADNPRWDFATPGLKVLYKLYAARRDTPGTAKETDAFLSEFLREVSTRISENQP